MGFFDKLFEAAETLAKPSITSEQEAFLTILAACGSADGDIESSEWDTIYDTLFEKKMFNSVDIWALIDECKKNIKAYPSLADAVNDCAPKITKENVNMVFATCTDLVLIDGVISSGEKAIIGHLKDALSVSDDLATKIVEVLLIRNYNNN
jgi:hypothetical protein